LTATRSILVVDDDPLQREILAEMLQQAGYVCRTAEDGDVAIACLREAPSDLVVLDMIMPNREGIETLRDIRAGWPDAKVMMISAGTRVMTAGKLLETAAALGADAVFAKPLRADIFLPEVVRLLSAKRDAA
jgi:DNA-binding response OmpR family regulator